MSRRGADVFEFDQIVLVSNLVLGDCEEWKQNNKTPVIHKLFIWIYTTTFSNSLSLAILVKRIIAV